MKKLLILITLLLVLAALTFKRSPKPVSTEMALPTPVATPILAAASPTTSLALVFTPTPESTVLEYSIEDIKGTALIMPFDSTVPETAEEGESVEAGDSVITKDNSEMTLALNNNTLVHIGANSQVKVADLTPNTTHGFTSRLELLLGNVLSEVEKLNESKSSFEIDAGGVVCGVRGTGFEVQKQDDNVVTNTFHGIVEMKKNGQVQKVTANQHSTFSLKKSGFLPQRSLNLSEKKHYQTWSRIKTIVQQKRQNRLSYPMDLSRKPVRQPRRPSEQKAKPITDSHLKKSKSPAGKKTKSMTKPKLKQTAAQRPSANQKRTPITKPGQKQNKNQEKPNKKIVPDPQKPKAQMNITRGQNKARKQQLRPVRPGTKDQKKKKKKQN